MFHCREGTLLECDCVCGGLFLGRRVRREKLRKSRKLSWEKNILDHTIVLKNVRGEFTIFKLDVLAKLGRNSLDVGRRRVGKERATSLRETAEMVSRYMTQFPRSGFEFNSWTTFWKTKM